MKRVVIGLMVLILALFLTSAVFAQAIPKTVCLNCPGTGDTFHLVIKNMGNVKTSLGNKKMYVVTGNVHNGAAYSFPVTGTAYLIPSPPALNLTNVHMNLTGTVTFAGDLRTAVYEIVWDYADTTNPVGIINIRTTGDIIFGEVGPFVLNLVDCVTDPIPFDAENLKPLLEGLKKQ
jgi:hypothetical protein